MLRPPPLPPVHFCSLFNDLPSPPQRKYFLNDPQPEIFANSKNLRVLTFREHKLSRIDRKLIFRDH